jgi:gentisate 1,2-dioxygenase
MSKPGVFTNIKVDAYSDLKAGKERNKELKSIYSERVARINAIPAWEAMQAYGSTEPKPRAAAALWRYQDVRAALIEACDLISAKDAERRTLLLRNPGLPKDYYGATPFLIASFQLVTPGEPMSPHRHSQTALRISVEGDDGFTSVEGEKVYVKRGDVVIQPPNMWHYHGNDGKKPGIWFDGLDVGIVTAETAFFDGYGDNELPVSKKTGDSRAIYGSNMLPANFRPTSQEFRVYHYPFERTLEALAALERDQGIDPYHGVKLRFANPLTGGSCMATMSAFMQSLPKGFHSLPYRSTESTIVFVVEGSGETSIGDVTHQWGQGDVFVVPSWQWCRHKTMTSNAILYSYSDHEAQERLCLWREQRGNSPAVSA